MYELVCTWVVFVRWVGGVGGELGESYSKWVPR